jgi:hypothetical protein
VKKMRLCTYCHIGKVPISEEPHGCPVCHITNYPEPEHSAFYSEVFVEDDYPVYEIEEEEITQ